ncbi:Nuclear transcription factor Y subunit C-6 [Cardamine amara subsp. amara]|uniref:Nuclear transcription factor Y subunit C-6 n=1 Tax=Cardamine amara subsp. amara TaxID=228776 RepID=A0ABD1B2U1_CARAN
MENHRNIIPNHNHQAPPPQPPQIENPQFRDFWLQQIETMTTDFKSHQLPLSRIKKIMKSDPEVNMISAEAPIFFAKACEMFIVDLTTRSWLHTEESKRRTLQKSDISAAVDRTFTFDFLLDVIPKDDSIAGDPDDGVAPYYYPQGVVMGTPVVDGSGTYAPPEAWPGAWNGAAGDGEDEAGENGGNGGGE